MTYTHEKQKINCPGDIAAVLQAILNCEDEIDREKEHFWVVGVNGAHNIIFVELATMGLVDQTPVHPREVYRRAISAGCSAVMVGHNHPSGQLKPSKEDAAITARLRTAGDVIGIQLLNHVIITNDGFYSFAEHGQL